jgi:hypothetical protein
MNTQHTYQIEITDLFGGEANYSWVRRFEVRARSFRGAINAVARQYGSGWKRTVWCGDYQQYNLRNAAITCFVTEQA